MCTPIGHTILGFTIAQGWIKGNPWKRFILVIVVLVAANVSDFDYIFGFFSGDPNRYHRTWTHTITFALAVGGLSTLISLICKWDKPLWFGGLVTCLLLSHLFLDYFTLDRSTPKGIPLFWPLSQRFFVAPITFFPDVVKSSHNATFFKSLFVGHNFRTLLRETIYLGPLFSVVLFWRNYKKRGQKNAE